MVIIYSLPQWLKQLHFRMGQFRRVVEPENHHQPAALAGRCKRSTSGMFYTLADELPDRVFVACSKCDCSPVPAR
jgi:hypothetical protein